MPDLPEYLSPDQWLSQMFSSREACTDGIVKRKVRDVERLVGREAFVREVKLRNFRALQIGRHYIVICNQHPIRVVR